MSRKCMLTTIDNPFDPIEQFTSWFMFDNEKGYNSCSYLSRIARTSHELSVKKTMKKLKGQLTKSLNTI